ncbi:MAG: hypothetical protein OEY20_06990 [Gemmatimonadota bacterium]|nr:hypothetical protein [Gemmatimonadota bacterium]
MFTLFGEVHIRNFGVGLIALAAFAAAGFLLRRRRPAMNTAGSRSRYRDVGELYVAGL